MLTVDDDSCVACGWCQTFCHVDAMRAWGKLLIDRAKCDDCMACIQCCPTDSLSMTHDSQDALAQP